MNEKTTIKILNSKDKSEDEVIAAIIKDNLLKQAATEYVKAEVRLKHKNNIPEYLIVHLLHEKTFKFETVKLTLDVNKNLVSIEENYVEKEDDY